MSAIRTLATEAADNGLHFDGLSQLAGIEGFLGNADTMFEQGDSDALQWESFLLVLGDLFEGRPFRVTDVVERLESKAPMTPNIDAKRLREAFIQRLERTEKARQDERG